jgi:hypothetical protein
MVARLLWPGYQYCQHHIFFVSCIVRVEGCTTTARQARCYVLSSGYRMGSRICAHSKPYAPCVVKPWEMVINVTPLCCICGVPKLTIFLKLFSAFVMPMQELDLLSCCEPPSQSRNEAKIPCHPHRSPSVNLLLLASDLAGLVLVISISSPPSFSSCTDHSHTWGTCHGLHNLHRTIHNCPCMHGFIQLLFPEDRLSSSPH